MITMYHLPITRQVHKINNLAQQIQFDILIPTLISTLINLQHKAHTYQPNNL